MKNKKTNLIFLNLGSGQRNKFILIKTLQDNQLLRYFVIGDITKYPQHMHLYYEVELEGKIEEINGGLLDIIKTPDGKIIGSIWGKSNVYDGYDKLEMEMIADLIKTNLNLSDLKVERSKPYSLF